MTGAPALRERLLPLLGEDGVKCDAASIAEAAKDKWFASSPPDLVAFPRDTREVSEVLKIASDEGVPVTTRGAGYGYVGGCVPVRGGIVLSTARMNRILEVSAEDFVAVVEPGVRTAEVAEAARKQGLFYPPDPASLKDCSIGGNIATNAGGPRCLKYGVTRHYVLGLEVVLADGTIVSAGGRTHKNKTGFDLIGVFVGSEGMLGVVTRATLRLLPLPPAKATLSASFASIEAAAAAVQAVFRAGFLPAAVEIADAFTLQAAREFAGPGVPPGEAHLLLEVDGQEGSVQFEIRQLEALLDAAGAVAIDVAFGEEGCERLWMLRRKFSESLKATGLKKLNEDVVVPRGRLVDLIRFAREQQASSGFPIACFGHAGDGNIHVNIMIEESGENLRKAEETLDALFRQVLEWGGAITGEHGIGLAKKRWWSQAAPGGVSEMHRRIKAALDPANILNPGKFLDS